MSVGRSMWSWWLWLTRTASIGGRSSKRSPGGRWRRGPTTATERSAQVGSVRMLTPSIWMRNVAWLTHVTRRRPSVTHTGGGGPGGVSVKSRHGPRRDVAVRRAQSRKPVVSGSGWWKRCPSKYAGSFQVLGTAAAAASAANPIAAHETFRLTIRTTVYGQPAC